MLYRALTEFASVLLRAAAPLMGASMRERLALSPPKTTPGGIWVHAASVGELNSARIILEALARDLPLTVTTNSKTGLALARDMGFAASLAPLDVPGAIRRFLDEVQPSVAVTIENELWPNRVRLLSSYGIAQVVLGARISARSAGRWARLQSLIGPTLQRLNLLSAQDSATEARLLALGLRQDALAERLNLKLLAPAQIRTAPHGPKAARTILAASTHEGEDEIILQAFARLLVTHPDLRLILAPRHPERGDAVARLIAGLGLGFVRRSSGGGMGQNSVLLADSLGEMGEWYQAAGICVTGGSFTDHGGHTPWEPAAYGCAIIHGPHIGNFLQDYRSLADAGGAISTDEAGLHSVLQGLIDQPARPRQMGAAARALLTRQAGDPAPLIARIRNLSRQNLATSGHEADMIGGRSSSS